MQPWPGHLPITAAVLFALFQRVETADREFSQDERVLFTASEFWAAVSGGELRSYLRIQPAGRLRSAALAFASMGAADCAREIFSGLDALRNSKTRACHNECIDRLECQLRKTDDPVDVLIAQMARRCSPAATVDAPLVVQNHFS